MPLSVVDVAPGLVIKAAHITQFYSLLTGAMTDQPVTFANTLTVGGSQSAASVPLRAASVAAGTANVFEVRTLPTDANPVLSVSRTGVLSFGAGGGTAVDATITRTAPGILTVSGLTINTLNVTGNTVLGGVLTVIGGASVGGAFTMSGDAQVIGNLTVGAGGLNVNGPIVFNGATTAGVITASAIHSTGTLSVLTQTTIGAAAPPSNLVGFNIVGPIIGAGNGQTSIGFQYNALTQGIASGSSSYGALFNVNTNSAGAANTMNLVAGMRLALAHTQSGSTVNELVTLMVESPVLTGPGTANIVRVIEGVSAGAFLSTAGIWTNNASWASLKTNIEPVPAHERTQLLDWMRDEYRPVRYRYGAKTQPYEYDHFGFLLDDMPESVRSIICNDPEGGISTKDTEGFLLAMVQEMAIRIKTLEARAA
jgi:hypothetical protein